MSRCGLRRAQARQRLATTAQVRVGRHRAIGRPAPGRRRRLPRWRPAPPPAAPGRPARATGCSATGVRSGRNASGRAAASSRRMVTASWIAASASSRRPRSPSALDRLFSDRARSGRNASGRAAASSRRMVTASWIAASASSRRPSSASALRQVGQRPGQVGPERVRAGRGQLPVVWAASWIAASASSRRPRSASQSDRLFSDAARSGRNASGRAAASSR